MNAINIPRKERAQQLVHADNEPSAIVGAAIAAAGYADAGAPFSPLLLKVAQPSDFTNFWNSSRGDTQISFFYFNGRSDGFATLGDQAAINNRDFSTMPILLVKPMPGHEDALAHPTGFTWILDDHKSGNDADVDYWWPIAPNGYSAVGIALTNSGNPPDPAKYWCVKNTYLQSAPTQPAWNDSGSHWSHNGDLSVPVLSARQQSPGPSLLLAPTTFLSDEGGGGNYSYVLVLQKCMLPVSGSGAPDPVYSPNNTQGTTTGMGVGQVAVVPCTTMSDPNRGVKPADSPFYYLASQPFWQCLGSYSTPAGGSFSQSVTIGTSQEQSTSVQNTTSLTIGAEVGVEAGPVSASMSVSYTNEMSVTVDTRAGSHSEVTDSIILNLPSANISQIWQRATNLEVYRTNGSTLVGASYGNSDLRVTQSPS